MNEEDYKLYRDQLADLVSDKGIQDDDVLDAIRKVPRHLFIPDKSFTPQMMYDDRPLEIGEGQTISQPFTVAFQTELLKVKKGDKILEIGTGSGYQSAVLAEMGAEVYTIERFEKLFNRTKNLLQTLGYKNIHTFLGDGNLGIPLHAPYDKVIVTAATTGVPKIPLQQLKDGGIMVAPVNGHVQQMQRITKISEGKIDVESFGQFFYVPMLGGVVMADEE
jgi:protein-L-isoaspartate(D-aspartate) O-methyltransferase